MSWYFYNAVYDIDDPITSGLTLLDAVKPPESFTIPSTFTLISPNPAWKPFSPADVNAIATQREECAVGYRKLLFKVKGECLEPIYWDLGIKIPVHKATWVFASTMTPMESQWELILDTLYQNVEPWTEKYKADFEEALASGNVDKVSARFPIDSRSMGRIMFSPAPQDEPNGHILSAYQSSTAKFLHEWSRKKPQAVDVCKFSYSRYKQLHKLPDRPGDEIEYNPPQVSKLVMVLHGIGQKLTVPTEKRNFTFAVEKLRTRMVAELNACGREDETVLLLPIIWRHAFRVENAHVTPESIRPPFMTEWRDRFNDFMYDVPYYMSSHQEFMVAAAVKECNRIYSRFMIQHPYFGGPIDMIGHSLGSVIAADILSAQDTVASASSQLMFDVTNFITCGSPLGFFLYLRTAQLIPRGAETTEARFGCLAVKQIYNVVHPYDFVASLLSPTVRGGCDGLDTALVPKEYGTRRKSRLEALTSRFAKVEASETFEPSDDMLALNANGQLDWVLQSSSHFEIMGALTAHSNYWVNSDFARMLVHLGKRAEFSAKTRKSAE